MCDEEQEIQYRTFPYVCQCALGYELDLACQPFARAAAGEYDFLCGCGSRYSRGNPAGLPGRVVSFRAK